MADTMVTKKTNITTVCEEDKIFIRAGCLTLLFNIISQESFI